MKKLLLVLFALIPLAGCASSGGGYASGGGAYFYGDCLYLENCYDGYYRNDYYYYGYPTLPVSPYERLRVEKLARRGSTRRVSPHAGPGGLSSGSASANGSTSSVERSSPATSGSFHSTITVAPRGGPSPAASSAPAPPPPVSRAAPSR